MTIISGFESYAITIKGDVYRISYDDKSNYHKRTLPHKLTPTLDKYGYLKIKLSIKGKTYYRTIHRLVAETFIPNPNNLPQVNHIDGNKLNNDVSNLEWVTPKENTLHAYLTGLHKGVKTKVLLKRDKEIKFFDSIEKASSFLKHDRHCFTRNLTTDSRHGVIDGWNFELIGGKNRKFKGVKLNENHS